MSIYPPNTTVPKKGSDGYLWNWLGSPLRKFAAAIAPYISGGGGGIGNVQYKEVTITSAELVNDLVNGIELLPAPGAGLYNQLIQIIAEVAPAPTPPDLGGITNIYIYGINYGNLLSFDPIILSTLQPMYSVGIGYALYSANGIMNAYDIWVNDNWGVRSDGGAIVSCDTNLKLKIWYVTREFTG